MLDRQGRLLLLLLFLVLVLFDSTFELQTEPLRSFADKLALLELRSTLGLRSREWPVKEDPCLEWIGVQCDNGRIVGLDISGSRRTRIGKRNPRFAVDALGNLTSLVYFNASRFLLPGSIPDWFGRRMRSLQVLDLRSCSIKGVIPSSLGNLTELTELYFADNTLTGNIPSSLGQLLKLSVLDLSKNSLTGPIPASLGALGNVSRLDLSSNFLFQAIPPVIGNLSKLQYLNLSNNNLHSHIPARFGKLSSLVDLDLSSNTLSGSIPQDLRGLRNLQKMILGNNILGGALTTSMFAASTQLQVVILRHNKFTNSIPDVLWSISTLQLLDVAGNNFTGLLPDVTLNGSTAAAVLNISQNKFYGELKSVLNRFSFIDLSENYFEGELPEYARNNASLDQNCLQSISKQRSVEECRHFYADRGLIFDNFGQPTLSSKRDGKSHKKVIILVAVLGGVGLIVLLALLILLLICCCKRSTADQRDTDAVPARAGFSPPPPELAINFSILGDVFTYQQLLQATGDFSDTNLIKHGHSGDLFQGILENRTPIVIKRIDLNSNKKETHLADLALFSKVSHTRLVPLLGHCLENNNEKFLVYKYMPNRDLSSSLFRKTSSEEDGLQSLDWITRLKIATGAAEGLAYLHHECTPPLVHRDVQASSILLDDKFEVRLGSLSDVCVQEGDTHQNVISRLLRLPTQSSEQQEAGLPPATCAYDVYCFGKVLLELVTGRLDFSAVNDTEYKGWLDQTLPYISIYEKELVTTIIDPSLIIDDDLLEEVWAVAIVAKSCLNPKPSKRPLMKYIFRALENPHKVVREDSDESERFRTSSRGSWNAALFGSWRSTSDVAVIPGASNTKMEDGSSMKQPGTTGSQISGQNVGNSSSSRRRHSTEIFPEPCNPQDIERPEIQSR